MSHEYERCDNATGAVKNVDPCHFGRIDVVLTVKWRNEDPGSFFLCFGCAKRMKEKLDDLGIDYEEEIQ